MLSREWTLAYIINPPGEGIASGMFGLCKATVENSNTEIYKKT
jgi:hypothetical protein